MARCLPCIACGRELKNVDRDADENQPYAGTAFVSHGHYGSTAYDPMDGHYLEINICDLCLVTHADRVEQGRDRRPILEDGPLGPNTSVVGWDESVRWRLVPWNPDARTYDHVLKVAREEFQLVFEDEPDETGGNGNDAD